MSVPQVHRPRGNEHEVLRHPYQCRAPESYYGPYQCRSHRYIAPEAYCGIYTTASDMFALGVMLYKVSTGSLPFCEEIFDDEPGQNYVNHVKMKQIRSKLRLAKVQSSKKWS